MSVPRRYTQIFGNYDKAFSLKIHDTVFYRTQDAKGIDIRRPVPVVFATPERAFAQVAKQIARKQQAVDISKDDYKNIPLPIISISRTSPSPDWKRFVQVKLRKLKYDLRKDKYLATYMPFPLDLPYQIDVWTRTIDDLDDITNQLILWLRANEFYLHVSHPEPFGDRIVLVEFGQVNDTSQLDPKNEEQRSLRRTLTYNVHGWLCRETEDIWRAEQVITDFYTNDGSGGWDHVDRVTVAAQPAAPGAPVVPVEVHPVITTNIFAALIVGQAQPGLNYGSLVVPAAMTIIGMSVSVNGNPPTGGNLVLQLQYNGATQTDKQIVVTPGVVKNAVTFGTALLVSAGDTVGVHCLSVGTIDPGEWIEVQLSVNIATT